MPLIAQNSIWRWLLGDEIRSGTPELRWANLPESWGVFVLLAGVAVLAFGVAWLYRHELAECPRWAKRFLAVVRLGVLLLLLLMFLQPTVTFKQVRTSKPTIAILRDTSQSIAHADKYRSDEQVARLAAETGVAPEQLRQGGLSRAELLQHVWEHNDRQRIRQLREKATLRVLDFADNVQASAVLSAIDAESSVNAPPPPAQSLDNSPPGGNPNQMPAVAASGKGSDLGLAIREALADSRRLAAIIMFSDGQHNGGENPIDQAEKAAALNIPILTVALGDPSRPTNLAVTDIYVQATARPNEPFQIEGLLYAQDLAEAKATVQLVRLTINPRTGKPDEEQVAETRDVTFPSQGGRVRIDFQQTIDQPGKYLYKLRVAAAEREVELTDNERLSNPLEVTDEKVRVLLISGAPNWNYQMVQRLLQRDANISLTCWLQTVDEGGTQAGNERISRLPRSLEEMGRYNVIMLMDPNPDEFDREWIDHLKLFCQRKAGGLLYMAGPQYTADFLTLNDLNGIRDILPVRFSGDEILESTQLLESFNTRPGRMLVKEQNLDHPIMTFVSDPGLNRQIWEELPGIYWSFPTLAAKPIAQVLLERGDVVNAEGNQPLLVVGRYGAGNVVYVGFTGSWRWRRVGLQAQYFDRFWIQLTSFLTETRSLSGSRRGTIDVDRNEYELGDKVILLARALNERYEPLIEPALSALVRGEGNWSQTVELRLLPGQEGAYEGSLTAQRTGTFQVEVALPGASEPGLIEPISFRVVAPSAESSALWLNEKLLREIAAASRGQAYSLDQIEQLIADLPRLSNPTELNSPPIPLWDLSQRLRYLCFGLPVLLLAVEWAARKKFKLL
jgi:hypothetical protein